MITPHYTPATELEDIERRLLEVRHALSEDKERFSKAQLRVLYIYRRTLLAQLDRINGKA